MAAAPTTAIALAAARSGRDAMMLDDEERMRADE
jgi:hypothetical protein